MLCETLFLESLGADHFLKIGLRVRYRMSAYRTGINSTSSRPGLDLSSNKSELSCRGSLKGDASTTYATRSGDQGETVILF
jgi:hypothetical protein